MSGKREKKVRKLEKRVELLEHRVAVCETWTPVMMHKNQVEAQRSGFDLERTSHEKVTAHEPQANGSPELSSSEARSEALSLLAGTKHSGMREDETSPRRTFWERLMGRLKKER